MKGTLTLSTANQRLFVNNILVNDGGSHGMRHCRSTTVDSIRCLTVIIHVNLCIHVNA